MSTNTVEQAEQLSRLLIESDWSPNVWGCNHDDFSDEEGRLEDLKNPYVINEFELKHGCYTEVGPALTLDELHKVFEASNFWPVPKVLVTASNVKNFWFFGMVIGGEPIYFDRTKNHAEDWTAILIWLLEECYVTAEQVNDILKEG